MFELFTLIPLDITAILPLETVKPLDKVIQDMAADVGATFKAIIVVAITILVAIAVFKRGFSLTGLATTACAAAVAVWLLLLDGFITLGAVVKAWFDTLTQGGS